MDRLTPDRQSKKGALWSHKPLDVEQVTATLKFRIHGQVRLWCVWWGCWLMSIGGGSKWTGGSLV